VELGIGFRGSRFLGAANVYYMDFRDEIIKKGGLDRFGQPITGNADHTVHRGVELSGEMQILPQLFLSGNFLASKNELKSYRIFEFGGETTVLDGNPIAGFPNTLGNLRLAWAWQRLYVSLILKYVGKQYTDNFKNEENSVDVYEVLNFSMRYDLGKLGFRGLTIQARVNNLLNKKFLAHGEGVDFFPAATRNGFVSLQYEL
ncbi:MAG: TonB-dependent receptor domain-containing protein, partial [bacterium]